MGVRRYKNYLHTHSDIKPFEEKIAINSEPFQNNGGLLPKTVGYKDIDIAFKDWVETALNISFEDKKLETIALFTNQKFSEYMQSWMFNDDNRNMMMNFKIITRENNPQAGSMHNKNMNVVGEPYFLIDRVLTTDKNGRKYFLDYKMKQPYCVDLVYKVSVVTNKYELLNEFNMMVNDRFKAIQDYIKPNGHYMPMKLNRISDESEYNIDDRQFFSQSFDILVMAYIVRETDLRVEESPFYHITSFDVGDNHNRSKVELEIDECEDATDDRYYYQPVKMTIVMDPCENKVNFTMKGLDFVVSTITGENWRFFRLALNDEEVKTLNIQQTGDTIIASPVCKYIPTTEGEYNGANEYDTNEVIKNFEKNPEIGMTEKYLTKYLPQAYEMGKRFQKLVLQNNGETYETHYYRLSTEYKPTNFTIKELTDVDIFSVRKINPNADTVITLYGYNPNLVYDRKKDGLDVSPSQIQEELDIEVQ